MDGWSFPGPIGRLAQACAGTLLFGTVVVVVVVIVVVVARPFLNITCVCLFE